jgi:predicted O-methyltransferase YrrM
MVLAGARTRWLISHGERVEWRESRWNNDLVQSCMYVERKRMTQVRPEGVFSDAEGAAYAALCREVRKGRIAEVGVSQGRSLSFVLEVCTENENQIFAIDRWLGRKRNPELGDGRKVAFLTWKSEHDKVNLIHPIEGDSLKVARQFGDQSLDLVMLDAKHSYRHVYRDIRHWQPKVRKGGTICGHDYSASHPGVRKAVNKYFGGPDGLAETFWWKRL